MTRARFSNQKQIKVSGINKSNHAKTSLFEPRSVLEMYITVTGFVQGLTVIVVI